MYFPAMPVLETPLRNLCQLVIATIDIIKKISDGTLVRISILGCNEN